MKEKSADEEEECWLQPHHAAPKSVLSRMQTLKLLPIQALDVSKTRSCTCLQHAYRWQTFAQPIWQYPLNIYDFSGKTCALLGHIVGLVGIEGRFKKTTVELMEICCFDE